MPSLTCQVDPVVKATVVSEARRRGICEAQLVRQLLAAALMPGRPEGEDAQPAVTGRMTIRIPLHVRAFIDQAVFRARVPSSRWVAMLLVAQDSRQPQWTPVDWTPLERSRSELNSIGRNLNQLVRALHAGYGYRYDAAFLQLLQQQVANARLAVREVCASSQRAWGISHDSEE